MEKQGDILKQLAKDHNNNGIQKAITKNFYQMLEVKRRIKYWKLEESDYEETDCSDSLESDGSPLPDSDNGDKIMARFF